MARKKAEYIFAPEERRGNAGCLIVVLAVALALLASAWLMNHASNQRVELKQEKVSVMALDKAYEGFTVLHLSDLHAAALGSDIELWQELLFGKTFHAVVFSGDMVGSGGDYEPMLSLIHTLRQIRQEAPVYFIAGGDDPAPVISTQKGSTEALEGWVRAAQKQGAIYLDAPVSQQVGKKTVWFVPQYLYDVDAGEMLAGFEAQKQEMEKQGAQYTSEGGAAYRAVCYRLDAMRRTLEALQLIKADDLQIAVNHSPLDAGYVRTSLEWADRTAAFNFRNISLLLCGHQCGGQWRIPGVGPLYVPEIGWFPGDAGVMGMQRINSINQYISPGLGASEEHPLPGRLFNQPAATLLKFTGNIQ